MLKATAHLPPNHGKGKPFAQLVLTSDQRRLRRKVLAVKGEEIMVDFPEAMTLEHFGGLRGVQSAAIDDMVKVAGISRPLAERIYKHLHATS